MELTLPLRSSDKRRSLALSVVVAVTFWVACGFGSVPASLLKDIPVPAGYSLPGSFIHIKGNANFQVVFLRAGTDFGNDGALLLYDSTGANTSVIPLTPNIYHDVGSGGPEIGIVSNTVVIIGTAIGAISPNVIRHNLYQYTLGSQSPLPTTATLVTNFQFGATNLFGQPRITETTNGGMVIAENEEMTQNTLSLLYMFPNGTITNYGYVTFYGASGGNFPTLGSAQQADGTIWTFGNKDAMNGTNASSQFTNYSGGIALAQSFSLVDSVGGVQTSYFEYNYPEAIQDTVSNRIILCYCNPNYIQNDGNVQCRATTINVTGFLPNTNHYLLSQSSNMVDRVAQSAITQVGTNIVLAYVGSFTNCSEQTTGYPFYLQSFTDGEQNAPIQQGYTMFTQPIAYHPHRLDYAVQLTNGTYHIFLFGGSVYYVDPVAGSDSNDGASIATAWQHIPGAIGFTGTGWPTHFNPGDKVVVKGGSTNFYQVQFFGARWAGNLSFDSITLQSGHLLSPQWGTTRAIIDENSTNVFAMAFGEGGSTPLQGIALDGFEVRNIEAGDMPSPWSSPGQGGSCCIQIGGNNPVLFLSIRNCYLHDALRSVDNTGHGIEGNQGVTNFLIYQNVIGPAIGTKGIEPFSCTSGSISNNFITGTGDHCVALSASAHVDFLNNLIITLTNGVHEPTYAMSVAGANHCDVWNNLIFQQQGLSFVTAFDDWKSGIGMYAHSGVVSHDNRYANNTIAFLYQAHNGGLENGVAFGGNDVGVVSNITFVNNIIFNTTNSVGPNCMFYQTAESTNQTIQFNDMFSQGGSAIVDKYTGTHNFFTVAGFPADSGTTYTSNQQLNPIFTGGSLPTGLNSSFQPNTAYFTLNSSAAPSIISTTRNTISGDSAHGYSSNPSKFAVDIAGITRSFWSMGAYELTAGGGGGNTNPPVNVHVTFIGNMRLQGNIQIK